MKLYDVVTLTEDMPEIGLCRGQVGTLVEQYESDVFEVEFSGKQGCTYALSTLDASKLMVLHYQPLDKVA